MVTISEKMRGVVCDWKLCRMDSKVGGCILRYRSGVDGYMYRMEGKGRREGALGAVEEPEWMTGSLRSRGGLAVVSGVC